MTKTHILGGIRGTLSRRVLTFYRTTSSTIFCTACVERETETPLGLTGMSGLVFLFIPRLSLFLSNLQSIHAVIKSIY